MDKGPQLLSDSVYKVIKLIEHSRWAPPDISGSLQNCALVSKAWNTITRPLILESVCISFTGPAGEWIATLQEILDLDPSYAGMVWQLKLSIRYGQGQIGYEKHGESLLAFVKHLTGLTHLLVDPSDGLRSWECLSSLWLKSLPTPAQESLTYICALPLLRVLDFRGLELPPSVFVHHPALEHLTLAYRFDL
ncbi:hypothetical protein BKA70DRAFT_1445647 [Coprinopsis sp. MPI-PUGE-AT-0042]|nr:hypothetical protein BKA70DRAFT_1445647 [Coprinopsis sp. MPI-PUGE-AT-0042]